jgi:hypothetical protein
MVNPTPGVIKTIVNEVKNQPRTQDPKGQKERPWERVGQELVQDGGQLIYFGQNISRTKQDMTNR